MQNTTAVAVAALIHMQINYMASTSYADSIYECVPFVFALHLDQLSSCTRFKECSICETQKMKEATTHAQRPLCHTNTRAYTHK